MTGSAMTMRVFILLCLANWCWGVEPPATKREKELVEKIRALESSLERTKTELTSCYKQMESKPGSLVGQMCSSFGSCFLASSPEKTFKPFVSEMLRILELERDSGLGVELRRELHFSTSHTDLQTLRRFLLYDDIKFIEVQEILLAALSKREGGREGWINGGLDIIQTLGGNKIHPTVALVAIACVVLCVVLVPLLLGARKRMILIVLFCYCIIHTWLGEYWKAVAKKEAVLAKHGPNMKNCRLDKRGFAGSLSEFFNGLFNGKEDPCEEYYRAAMVDPAFEVSLVHALVESVSQLLGVLGGLGKALGHFVTNFLAPLPLVWKIPALVVGAVFLLVLCLVLSGYQFSSLFFSIGPSKQKSERMSKKDSSKTAVTHTDTDIDHSESEHGKQKNSLSDEFRRRLTKDSAKKIELPYPSGENLNHGSSMLHSLTQQHVDTRPHYQN